MVNNRWFVWRNIIVLVLMVYGLSMSGCATTSLYSINMSYDASQALVPAYFKADEKASSTVISVAEFTDTRQMDDRIVVGRVVEKDGMKILVLPKFTKPTKVIASGIKEYFKKAGYEVADKIEQWDLKEETMPKGNGKILVGGNIEEMEISCRRGFLTNSYKANMKLTIYFADLVKGKIFYKSTVESISSQEHVLFSEERLGEQASIVLGDAIEKVFEERVVAQKIKEAIAQ
jgi:hypothetical protein